MSKRIVIVTYNWPPRNVIGTYRPYAWAHHWTDAGANVTVLTAEKQPFDAPLDYDVSNPPGVQVIEIPLGKAATLTGRAVRFELLRRLAKACETLINRWFSKSLNPRSGWRRAAQPIAMKLARDADIVVSTFPPTAAHLIARDMKRCNPNIRWVADYRDLWNHANYPDISEAYPEIMWTEDIEKAKETPDLLTTVSNALVMEMSKFTKKPIVLVHNGFDMDEKKVIQRLKEPIKPPKCPFRIVHTGTIYDKHRDPRPILDALDKLYREGRIRQGDVTVDFYGKWLEPIRQMTAQSAYARFIRVMGHVRRQDVFEAQRDADLLLLLVNPLAAARGVLTGKIFEYIVAGRPIICVGSRPENEIGKILSDTKTGLVLAPEEIARIRSVLADALIGYGIYNTYKPDIEKILSYSRARNSHYMLDCITK